MRISKQRVEAFSDGVIAIIVTIMVLNIPLPDTFTFNKIMELLSSIFVFFTSFFIVASQWNKHRFLFDNLEELSNMLIWRNFLFLFFLSLLPIFTKWVIQNPDQVVPAVGYDILYLLVNLSFMLILRSSKNGFDPRKRKDFKSEGRILWMVFFSVSFAMLAMFILSFYYPRISIVFFIGIPVASSLLNIIFDKNQYDRRDRHFKKHDHKSPSNN